MKPESDPAQPVSDNETAPETELSPNALDSVAGGLLAINPHPGSPQDSSRSPFDL